MALGRGVLAGMRPGRVLRNLLPPALIAEALRRNEVVLSADGAVVATTGRFTGRSPKDKYFVAHPELSREIDWGTANQPLEARQFAGLLRRALAHVEGRDLFVQDLYAGADPAHRLKVRVVTEEAWHNLFARNMFIRPPREALDGFAPDWTVLQLPSLEADPAVDGTNSSTVIAIDVPERLVLILGTAYAGEIKKSIFTVLNYVLPLKGVLPMHCSANIGESGDTALFFGLSGTGKTTLSSDPDRGLIGDDEHGWSDRGVFNFEGGCYAKTIRLSAEAEPQIYSTTRRFGTVLENVDFDPITRELDLDSSKYTENTRAAYTIEFIDNHVPGGQGGHPANVVMLTADAFGVLPPIARLSAEGAMYHFLSGYTAKVAGTEKGVTEPSATFSTCFGAPFLPMNPSVYSKMLGEKLAKHGSKVWLVNTGWTGGPYGVGSRMKIAYTRAMIRAALSGALDAVQYERHPVFNIDVPTSCPDVPAAVLNPRGTWADGAAYDAQAKKLAQMFVDNFKTFAGDVDAAVVAAGPRV